MSANDKSSTPTSSAAAASTPASGSWLKSNLAAIGSAAVFSVYAAGFARTRAAAEQFADAPLVRRGGAARAIAAGSAPASALPQPVAHNAPTAAVAAVSRESADSVVASTRTTSTSPVAATSPKTSAAKAPSTPDIAKPATSPAGASLAATVATVATVAASKPAPVVPPPTVAAAALPVQAAVAAQAAPKPMATVPPTIQPVVPTPVPASAPTQPPAAATPPATASARPAAAPPATDSVERTGGTYKDGTYTGWGTSRHGNIQATVEIKDGWIVAATISQCLTEYSCSWIAALPPQVTVRQNAEVDYVSGATQSSNAFYGALVQAIGKAK